MTAAQEERINVKAVFPVDLKIYAQRCVYCSTIDMISVGKIEYISETHL